MVPSARCRACGSVPCTGTYSFYAYSVRTLKLTPFSENIAKITVSLFGAAHFIHSSLRSMRSQTPPQRGASLESCLGNSSLQPHRKLVGQKPDSFGCSHPTAIPEKERINLPMGACSLPGRSASSGKSHRATSVLSVPMCCEPCGAPLTWSASFCAYRWQDVPTHGWNRVEDPAKIFNCCCLETCTGYLEDPAGGSWMHLYLMFTKQSLCSLVCVRRAP